MANENVIPRDIENNLAFYYKFKKTSLMVRKCHSELKRENHISKNDLEMSLQNEKKIQISLDEFKNKCQTQLGTVSELESFKEINEKLNTEINLRDNRIKEMKEVMSSNKFDFEVQMQNQISQHLREIETINKENEQKLKQRQDELHLVFNSSDIHRLKLEEEIKSIKSKYNDDLKEMNNKNSKLQISLAVSQKKIFELEEIINTLEMEKKNITSLKSSYVPAQNIPNNSLSKKIETNSKFFQENYNKKRNDTVNMPGPSRYPNSQENIAPSSSCNESDTESEYEKNNMAKYYQNNLKKRIPNQFHQPNRSKNDDGKLNLMPLPVSTTKQEKPKFPTRKRKLYNPNDLQNWEIFE